ncbi:MAG: hypothetical protein F4Z92_12035 [Gemmatimonadetes bacterium]|nr:hypothetical protein [Gemmatimonadota bacterium]
MSSARSASWSVRASACDRACSISVAVAILAASTAASRSRSILPHEVMSSAAATVNPAVNRSAVERPVFII